MADEKELVDLQTTLYNSKNETRKWLHCSRRDWIIDKILRYAKKDGIALEIGPGSGVYIPTLCKSFSKVHVSDIEQAYLKQAISFQKEFSNLECITDDITNTNLELNSYDLILCTEVIEHIDNSSLALKNIKKLLKSDGILILSTPQKYSPLELSCKIAFLPIVIDIVRFIYKEPILETGHINLLTDKQVKEQLKSADLNILEEHKSGMYLPVIAEFFGMAGLKFEQYLEKKATNSRFISNLLWTQYYIAKI